MELIQQEFVESMGQRGNDVAWKDAQIKLSKEECASSMAQRSNDAAVKDAQVKLRREEYAKDTEQTAILTTNLLLFHHVLDQILIRLL